MDTVERLRAVAGQHGLIITCAEEGLRPLQPGDIRRYLPGQLHERVSDSMARPGCTSRRPTTARPSACTSMGSRKAAWLPASPSPTNDLPLSIGAQSDAAALLPGCARPGAGLQPGAVRGGDRRAGGRVAPAHGADLHRHPAEAGHDHHGGSRSRRCGATRARGGRLPHRTASGASSAGTWLWKLVGNDVDRGAEALHPYRHQGRCQGRGQRDPCAALQRSQHATGLGPVQRRHGPL